MTAINNSFQIITQLKCEHTNATNYVQFPKAASIPENRQGIQCLNFTTASQFAKMK